MLEHCNDLLECERVLSSRIGEIGLLGQIPLSADDIDKLRNLISLQITADPRTGTDFLRDKAPTCLCCFLVWIGILKYQAGDYWTFVHQATNLPEGSSWQSCWGKIFIEFLSKNSLPTFTDAGGHHYVTPILAHGGIPDYCLEDFFKNLLLPIISGHLGLDPSDTEQILQEWQDRSSLFHFTDKPVRRFLLHGGKAAMDFLSRCIEMAQRAYEEGEVLSANEFGIPERIIQRFEQWWQSEEKQLIKKPTGPRFPRPIIMLSPEFGEVYLHVPPQRLEATDKETLIEIEIRAGASNQARREKLCIRRENSFIETEEIQISLSCPSEEYQAQLLSNGSILRSWTLKGVSEKHPWLAFDHRSKKMIQSDRLPRVLCWLVLPSRFSFSPGEFVRERGETFYGWWRDYCACLVDLAAEVSLPDEIKIPIASEALAEPKITDGQITPYVFSEGERVYSAAPQLLLPFPEQISRWQLSIVSQTTLPRRIDRNVKDLIDSLEQLQNKTEIEISLADLLSEYDVGRFRLQLRGPLGRDYSFRFSVVPQLKIEFDRSLYTPDQVSEAWLKITAPEANGVITEAPCSLEEKSAQTAAWTIIVPPSESSAKCVLSFSQQGQNIEVPLLVRVPRLRLAIQGLSGQTMWHWSHRALEISASDYEDAQELFLLVDIPSVEEGQAIISLEGTEQQASQRIRNGKARFELKRFSDTLRTLRRSVSRFFLSTTGHSLVQEIPVLQVQAKWLLEGLNWDQETRNDKRFIYLAWQDKRQVSNRVIRLWNRGCPRVVVLQEVVADGASELWIEKSITELPPGEYLLECAVEDEWAPALPGSPRQPDEITVFPFEVGSKEEQEHYANTQLNKFYDWDENCLSHQRYWQLINYQRTLDNLERWVSLGFQPTIVIWSSEQKDLPSTGEDVVPPFLTPCSLESLFEAKPRGCAEVPICCKTQALDERSVAGGMLHCRCSSDGICTFEVQAEEELRTCSKCGLLVPVEDFWEHPSCTDLGPRYFEHLPNEAFPVQLAVFWDPMKMVGWLQTFLSRVASDSQQLQKLESAFPTLRYQYDSSRYKSDWGEWLNGLIETLERILKGEQQETRSKFDLGWNIAYYQGALEAVLDCIVEGIYYGA